MAIQSAKQITPGIEIESGGTLDISAAKVLLRFQNKTADYTVLESDSGTWFTTYGDANAIAFTLPSNPKKGLNYWFLNSTANDVVITAATADTLYAYADDAADTLTSTNIAVLMLVVADGNKWYAVSFGNSLDGVTATVGT